MRYEISDLKQRLVQLALLVIFGFVTSISACITPAGDLSESGIGSKSPSQAPRPVIPPSPAHQELEKKSDKLTKKLGADTGTVTRPSLSDKDKQDLAKIVFAENQPNDNLRSWYDDRTQVLTASVEEQRLLAYLGDLRALVGDNIRQLKTWLAVVYGGASAVITPGILGSKEIQEERQRRKVDPDVSNPFDGGCTGLSTQWDNKGFGGVSVPKELEAVATIALTGVCVHDMELARIDCWQKHYSNRQAIYNKTASDVQKSNDLLKVEKDFMQGCHKKFVDLSLDDKTCSPSFARQNSDQDIEKCLANASVNIEEKQL